MKLIIVSIPVILLAFSFCYGETHEGRKNDGVDSCVAEYFARKFYPFYPFSASWLDNPQLTTEISHEAKWWGHSEKTNGIEDSTKNSSQSWKSNQNLPPRWLTSSRIWKFQTLHRPTLREDSQDVWRAKGKFQPSCSRWSANKWVAILLIFFLPCHDVIR